MSRRADDREHREVHTAFDVLLLTTAKSYADQGKGVYVRFWSGQQLRIDGEGVPFSEQATDKQLAFIARLADEKQQVAPDGPLTKAQASEVIDQLQAGTYDPDKWKLPF